MTGADDQPFMSLALRLARRGYGTTSPNPMVGAVLVKKGHILGRGWHRRAGEPHAEIQALHDAQRQGRPTKGATLFVTLEPCSTFGRTPPCTDAIVAAGISRVVCGAIDPNPNHSGRGLELLDRAGIVIARGALAKECAELNEAFNHWIVHRTPFVIVKAAMTLDGRIATASGESKWITGDLARACAMNLRQATDAILVGINTVLLDDPSLTIRINQAEGGRRKSEVRSQKSARALTSTETGDSALGEKRPRRIVLDALGRTPLWARVVSDESARLTTVVVSELADKGRVAALRRRANVMVAPLVPERKSLGWESANQGGHPRHVGHAKGGALRIDLKWLLKKLGAEDVTSLLVEGGGEVNASFLLGGFGGRVAFFYAQRS